MDYKRLSLGIETISILSAMEVPGVLMQVGCDVNFWWNFHWKLYRNFVLKLPLPQVSLALGDFHNDRMPLAATKRTQKAIGLFFSVLRAMTYETATEGDIKASFVWIFCIKIYWKIFQILVMQAMELRIGSLLEACKAAFTDVCDNFCFYKFHTVVHCPLLARWFGNLDVMDANR